MTRTVIFDLVGTLFSLDTITGRLEQTGGPEVSASWFHEALQTAMAATLSRRYLPFRQAVEISLTNLLEIHGVTQVSVPEIMRALKELPPEDGARECLKALAKERFRLVVLTNSSKEAAAALLQRSGLAEFIQVVISVDEVEKCKPHPRTYRLALDRMDVDPEEAWLVSSHGWDIYGAAAVDLHTIWVMNRDRRWPFAEVPPGATVGNLHEVPSVLGR